MKTNNHSNINNRQELKAFLSSYQIFTLEEIDILLNNTILRECPKGTVLLKEGEFSKECYAVIRGCIREYYLKDGIEKTTAFFTEGEPVNSFSSYVNNTPSKHFLECSEDCLVTVGNQSLIDEMCEIIPRLSNFIKSEVEQEAGALQERMAFFMTSSPEERLLNLMETNPTLLNRVPQHQIASYLGVTPESLSRIKKRVFSSKK
ncbi:MAG: Crp/Fnr family transcriptional regulator [Cytophagales bacterium]|nr:Crp/Fnr family transcriptional regulator [Cytophagales bacterium]